MYSVLVLDAFEYLLPCVPTRLSIILPLLRKLFASYASKSSSSSSSLQQIQKYLDMQDIEENTLQLWDCSQTSLDKLCLPALRALSVPASIATAGRVFSQGGIIMWSHRARMTDKLLSHLMCPKCNQCRPLTSYFY